MPETVFRRESHIRYFVEALKKLPRGYSAQESLRLTLCYFSVAGLDLLDALDQVNKAEIVSWVYSLQVVPNTRGYQSRSVELATNQLQSRAVAASQLAVPQTESVDLGANQSEWGELASGDGGVTDMRPDSSCLFGFRGSTSAGGRFSPEGSPPVAFEGGHLAQTYVALAILKVLGDDYGRVEREGIVGTMKALQKEDGSFGAAVADGQADIRFLFCAAAISRLLVDWRGICTPAAQQFTFRSQNYDGGFGLSPGLESHGGATYCALAALSLMEGGGGQWERREEAQRWCAQRQCVDGGVQGRGNKEGDACYSFWVGASLRMLGGSDWLHAPALRHFLLTCQYGIGGLSKRPSDYPDLLHSFYGICGLSLLGEHGLLPLDCALGISERAVKGVDVLMKASSVFDDVD